MPIQTDIVGKWNFVSSEGFDEYLKEVGVGWAVRTLAGKTKPTLEFTVKGDEWTMNSNSTFKNYTLKWKLGTVCYDKTADGRDVSSVFSIDNDSLLETSLNANSKATYSVLGDYLYIVIESEAKFNIFKLVKERKIFLVELPGTIFRSLYISENSADTVSSMKQSISESLKKQTQQHYPQNSFELKRKSDCNTLLPFNFLEGLEESFIHLQIVFTRGSKVAQCLKTQDGADFRGTWNFVSSEGFDEYLKEVGVGWAVRTLAGKTKPTLEFTVKGDEWTMNSNSTFKNYTLKWKLGTVCDDKTADGRDVSSVFSIENDHLVQVETGKGGGKDSRIERYIENGKLVIVCVCNGVKCTTVYKKAAL